MVQKVKNWWFRNVWAQVISTIFGMIIIGGATSYITIRSTLSAQEKQNEFSDKQMTEMKSEVQSVRDRQDNYITKDDFKNGKQDIINAINALGTRLDNHIEKGK